MLKKTISLTLATALLAGLVAHAQDPDTPPVGADEALERLIEGNERYRSDEPRDVGTSATLREETAGDQRPFAIVIGCADSRTAPEIVFDQNLGDLFVVRTVANLVDDYALGSIEYAVEHLGARLIVVLGHERCGGVTTALAGGPVSGHVQALVRDIQPAVDASRGRAGDPVANAVYENASRIADKIRTEAELGELASQIRVVAAYYDLEAGTVEWSQQ